MKKNIIILFLFFGIVILAYFFGMKNKKSNAKSEDILLEEHQRKQEIRQEMDNEKENEN